MKIMFISQEEEQAIERIQFGQQYMNETVDKIKQLLNNKQNNKLEMVTDTNSRVNSDKKSGGGGG